MRKGSLTGLLAVVVLMTFAPSAEAGLEKRVTLPDGVTQRLTYKVPLEQVTAGQNKIRSLSVAQSGRPAVDGWITGFAHNLVRTADSSVPSSDKVMFHHGVWVNRTTYEIFYASGEEKTQLLLPRGYGYRYRAGDEWSLNEMIHNLTPKPMNLSVIYTIDFIPDTSAAAAGITRALPIWIDTQRGIYPVFDVHKGSGGRDGEFTYPADADDPYGGEHWNERTLRQDGVLIDSIGHLHTGGLSTELFLRRKGAHYAGPVCKRPRDRSRTRKRLKRYRACLGKRPTVRGNRARVFESKAHYFEPAGPVSWDMAMVGTRNDWRVRVEAGDTLEVQATYETKIASWYESMGSNLLWWVPGGKGGSDPFSTKVDTPGRLNHGHYPENDVHGGGLPVVGRDPAKRPDGLLSGGPFEIGGYSYEAGNFRLPGSTGNPPVVEKGERFTFQMTGPDLDREVWHSLTSCKAPCNKSTGIAYPIADGEFQFDSGQLGDAGPPTVGRTTWSTPANLPVGTHTYFCRIHPLMRGSFRVKPKERGNRE